MNEETLHAAMKAVLHCIATIYREYAPEASVEIVRTAQTFPDFGRPFIVVLRGHIVESATAYGKGEHNPEDPWDVGPRALAAKLHDLFGVYRCYYCECQYAKGGKQQ